VVVAQVESVVAVAVALLQDASSFQALLIHTLRKYKSIS
jgi:hypothetical protein